MLGGQDSAVGHEGGGVEDILVSVHEANHGGDPFHLPDDPVQDREVVGDELGAQQEVFRRIARDGQFREHDQIGLRRPGRIQSFEHQSGIAVEVADGRVHLSQRNP